MNNESTYNDLLNLKRVLSNKESVINKKEFIEFRIKIKDYLINGGSFLND